MKKWLAILLAMVFIGASTQCLAECAGQTSKVPPCHQQTPHKCSIESQLIASSPDAGQTVALVVEPIQDFLPPIACEQCLDDVHFGGTLAATPPPLTILRV